MKQIENYENVQASTGEFEKLMVGGYICKITDVEDIPLDPKTNKGDYLRIEYDIAAGDFKGYYKEAFDKFGGSWWASFIRSYKETALGMFKHFTNCVEESNAGYQWDFNEKGLIGKLIGLVIGEEEYEKKDDTIATRFYVKDIKTVEQIKNGDFKVPELKKIERKTIVDNIELTPIVDDSDLPF